MRTLTCKHKIWGKISAFEAPFNYLPCTCCKATKGGTSSVKRFLEKKNPSAKKYKGK